MDEVRIGNTLRVIRIRKHLRQADVAHRAGVPREVVGRLERGGLGGIRCDTFLAVATALGIRADLRLRWQGGDLDRVMNQAHADLHEAIAQYLGSCDGWTWRPEVSFSIYGERGVIDILAWHAETRSLLIIELKASLVDPQDLAATMDRRVRLGVQIAEQFGWGPATASAWVVFADTRTNHRRVLSHSGLLRTAFPADGHVMRSWLREPAGRVSALSYWSALSSRTNVARGAAGPASGQAQRVRTPGNVAQYVDPSVADGALPRTDPHQASGSARDSG